MTPRERNGFISWTALGMLSHDVCAFQMPEGTSFGFMLREALEESGAPYRFGLDSDPDKIIEISISHPRYEIPEARWRRYTDDGGRYCLETYFVSPADQEVFKSGGSGLQLVAEICCEETEATEETSLYRFGELMIQKLQTKGCVVYQHK
ncbi:hypothetical protein [Bifidobacterium animalis]|uniref:hypothetical protein n=1 Tax=Bifidobacterium animalis TaxID=28025 RepID=UPI003F91AF2A